MTNATEITREVARRLRMARELAGLSQAQAAALLGLHRPSVTEVEAGRRRVEASELVRFARIYDVSLDWLTGGTAPTNSEEQAELGLVARELKRLKPEDLDRLMDLLRVLRHPEGTGE